MKKPKKKKVGRLRLLRRLVIGVVFLIIALPVTGYAILASLDFEDLRGIIQDTAKEATGRDLVVAGPVKLNIALEPSITLGDITLANAPWGSRDAMVMVKRLELETALLPLLSGRIKVKRLVVVEPDILLETDGTGNGNWIFSQEEDDGGDSSASGDASLSALPEIDRLLLRDGSFAFVHGITGARTELLLDRLSGRTPQEGEPFEFDLEASFNGAPLTIKGEVGPLADLAEGDPLQLSLDIKAAGSQTDVKASMIASGETPTITGSMRSEGQSLADFNEFAGQALPPLGPFALQSGFQLGGGQGALTGLAGSLGESNFKGELSFDLMGERPAFKGSVTSQLLRLADFAAQGGSQGGTSASQSPLLIPNDPLPVDALKAVDFDLALAVERLLLADGLVVEALMLEVKGQGGQVGLAPLSASLGGGSLEGQLGLDASLSTPALTLDFKGQNIDYGQLLKDMAIDQSIAGKMNLGLHVSGAGHSPHAIAASLNGETAIYSPGGQVNDKLFKFLSVGLTDILGPLFGNQSQSRLNCFVSRMQFQNGVGHSRAMLFDSESLVLEGDGRLDLRDESLDFAVDTRTHQASLASLAVPFLVKGTLKEPLFIPDPVGAAVGAAESVVDTGTGIVSEVGSFVSGLLGGSDSGSQAEASPCQVALAGQTTSPSAPPPPAPAASSQPSSVVLQEAQEDAQSEAVSEPVVQQEATQPASATSSSSTQESGSGSASGGNTGKKSFDEAVGDLKRDFKKLFGD